MAWGTVKVDQRRIEFAVRATQKRESMTALCKEFGICRATGYKWLERWRQGPLESFGERSRRPKSSPTQTPARIEELVVELRRRLPDWGAPKLAYRLKKETGIVLPRITLHRILVRRELVRRQDSHPAATKRFERDAPNQLWQMDFKGMPEPWANREMPLSIVDDHSRYLVALRWQQGMKTAVVRTTVTEVFEQAGVPQQMRLDHGTPWWNMASGIGLTQFSVWLMKQGIELIFSGYRHPQTQGKVERFHGSLERALLLRGRPTGEDWQPWLDEYREEFNFKRPHEALGMELPGQHWRPSERAYEPQPKQWEYDAEDEVKQLDSKGQIQLEGRRWIVAGALAGERVGLRHADQITAVFYRATLIRLFDRRSGKASAATAPERLRWSTGPDQERLSVYDVMKQDCLPCDET